MRYDNVYDGIDLRYYGNQRQLEYDFIVNAGADVNAIRLNFEGVQSVSIAGNGDLLLTLDSAGHSISFKAPVAYQMVLAGARLCPLITASGRTARLVSRLASTTPAGHSSSIQCCPMAQLLSVATGRCRQRCGSGRRG